MRKTIILSTLVALFGYATLAQASDRTRTDGIQVTRAAADDSHHARHDREARNERHSESGDQAKEARESHDENEAAEHQDRR